MGRIGLLRNNFVEKYCHVESHLRDVRSTRTNRGATEHLRVFTTNSDVSIINYTYYILDTEYDVKLHHGIITRYPARLISHLVSVCIAHYIAILYTCYLCIVRVFV